MKINVTDINFNFGSTYVAKAGDTMTGLLTVNLGSASFISPGPAGFMVIGAVDSQCRFMLDGYDTNGTAGGGNFFFRKARYPSSVRSVIQNGDDMGRFTFQGYDSANYNTSAFMGAVATETWTTTARGTRFRINTTANGTTSVVENFVVENDGSLLANGGNAFLDNNRLFRLRVYTVATLPTAGIQGRRAAVSDALSPTYGATVASGGAVNTPVYDNGSAWTCR